jgi:hypothetical protein
LQRLARWSYTRRQPTKALTDAPAKAWQNRPVAESRVEQFLAALPPHERGSVAGEVLRLYVGGLEAQLAAVRAVLALR